MTDDEIQDEREMTLEEKKRLREILGYGLSAALPLAYHPEDDPRDEFDEDEMPREIARLRAQVATMHAEALVDTANSVELSRALTACRAQLDEMTEMREENTTLRDLVDSLRARLTVMTQNNDSLWWIIKEYRRQAKQEARNG